MYTCIPYSGEVFGDANFREKLSRLFRINFCGLLNIVSPEAETRMTSNELRPLSTRGLIRSHFCTLRWSVSVWSRVWEDITSIKIFGRPAPSSLLKHLTAAQVTLTPQYVATLTFSYAVTVRYVARFFDRASAFFTSFQEGGMDRDSEGSMPAFSIRCR